MDQDGMHFRQARSAHKTSAAKLLPAGDFLLAPAGATSSGQPTQATCHRRVTPRPAPFCTALGLRFADPAWPPTGAAQRPDQEGRIMNPEAPNCRPAARRMSIRLPKRCVGVKATGGHRQSQPGLDQGWLCVMAQCYPTAGGRTRTWRGLAGSFFWQPPLPEPCQKSG